MTKRSEPLLCSLCGIETTDRVKEDGYARKPDNWSLLFVNWDKKKICFCSRCYDKVYEGWKLEEEN